MTFFFVHLSQEFFHDANCNKPINQSSQEFEQNQSKFVMSLFVQLNEDVCADILSKWCDVKNLSYLDSALCSVKYRPLYQAQIKYDQCNIGNDDAAISPCNLNKFFRGLFLVK